jgi:hypothetical protein
MLGVSIINALLLLLLFIFGLHISLTPIHTEATEMTLAANNDFQIQNTSSFIDESAIMHVYGEVKNISNKTTTNVIVNGSFFDGDGMLLNHFQRTCELPTINSGGICPFEILYIDTKTTNKVKDFNLSATGITTDESKPTTLKIYSDNSRLDILGFYYINGRISNEGSLTATNSSVVASLYDKDGKVIAIGRALAEPVNISSGNQASFGMAVTEKSQTYKTKSYSLVVYSDQGVSSPLSVMSK